MQLGILCLFFPLNLPRAFLPFFIFRSCFQYTGFGSVLKVGARKYEGFYIHNSVGCSWKYFKAFLAASLFALSERRPVIVARPTVYLESTPTKGPDFSRRVVNFADRLTSDYNFAFTGRCSSQIVFQIGREVTLWMSPEEGIELFYGISIAFSMFLSVFWAQTR